MSERKMPTVDDYPSNANSKERDKSEVEPIVRGNVKKKTSIFRSVRDEFIAEDAPTVGSYLLYDILLPALKDLVLDIGHGAIDSAFGGGGYRSSRRGGRDRSYISYNRYYDDRDRRRRDRDEERYEARRRSRDFDEFIFDRREDAEDVLDRMCDYLERFDDVPVSYFYDLLGETVPGDFTSDDWGWTNLAGARVRKVRGGYIIDLPKVKPI